MPMHGIARFRAAIIKIIHPVCCAQHALAIRALSPPHRTTRHLRRDIAAMRFDGAGPVEVRAIAGAGDRQAPSGAMLRIAR